MHIACLLVIIRYLNLGSLLCKDEWEGEANLVHGDNEGEFGLVEDAACVEHI